MPMPLPWNQTNLYKLVDGIVYLLYPVNESAIEKPGSVLGVFLVVVACIWIFAIVYVRKKYIEFNQVPVPADQVKPTGKRTRGKYVNVAELAKEKAFRI